MSRIKLACLLMVGLVFITSAASLSHADNWPQYRGPNRNGISTETGWLTNWPKEGLKILWKTSVGRGYSGVSVVDGKLYTLGLLPKNQTEKSPLEETISCLKVETGEVIWRYSYPTTLSRQYPGTRSSPTVEGPYVYTNGQAGELLCLDAATGKVIWQKSLIKDLGAQTVIYGYAASPLIVNDLLIVPVRIVDKDKNALLMAFRKSNGQEVWRTFDKSPLLGGGYWACPIRCNMNGKDCLVFSSGVACLGLDPFTGRILWKHAFSDQDLRRAEGHDGCTAQELVVLGNRVICCVHADHTDGFTLCLEINGSQTREVWRTKKLGNYASCNIIWQGHVFGIHHNDAASRIGPLCCFDIQTGEQRWEKAKADGAVTLVDGKFLSFTGEQVILFEASTNEYKELARSQILFAPEELAFRYSDLIAPILSNGRLYCRCQSGVLVCLDVRGK